MVSHNKRNGTSNTEYTTHIEVVPLCKWDLVIPRKEITGSSELLLVWKVSSNIHFISPTTSSHYEMSANKYFSSAFNPLITTRDLVNFMVLDVVVDNASCVASKETTQEKQKNSHFIMADIVVRCFYYFIWSIAIIYNIVNNI